MAKVIRQAIEVQTPASQIVFVLVVCDVLNTRLRIGPAVAPLLRLPDLLEPFRRILFDRLHREAIWLN